MPESGRVQVGPFEAEFIAVTHSVPDAVAVVLHTELGAIVHTGDFKLDATPIDGRTTDLERLRPLGRDGVALLMADSTNAERPGRRRPSGRSARRCAKIVAQGAGPGDRDHVLVAHPPPAAGRSTRRPARGRIVSVIGRSMTRNLNIARNLGYADVPEDVLVRPRRLDEFMHHQVVVICTGSQGEPRSALARIAHGSHPALQIHPTDTVVMSARRDPRQRGQGERDHQPVLPRWARGC